MTMRPEHDSSGSASPEARSAQPTLAEILDVILPHVEKVEEGFSAIRVTLDGLHEHVSGVLSAAPPPAAALPAAIPVQPTAVAPVPVRPTPEPSPPPPPEPAPTPPEPEAEPSPKSITISVGEGNWSQILFGDHLNITPSIGSLSGSLLADVYQGSFDAMALMGSLLTFRSELADRKPRLLKDMGEAFYRWKPGDNPTLRDALITWVHAELDAVGVGNRITLAQVGDRYDMQRHNAKERGVEVAEVQGWVVLRDNGKVYSKANVVVR